VTSLTMVKYRRYRGRWSKAYRYSVSNVILIVVIALTKYIPSHMTIAGNRFLVSYEGQPMTCYGCGDTGHLYQFCPKRRRVAVAATQRPITSWADIAINGTRSHRPHDAEEERATQQSEQENQGGVRKVEEEKAPQEDNAHTTEVTSEQNEGPERGEVNIQIIRSNATALHIIQIRDEEDSMECGEEMTEDTYTTIECQHLCKQLPEDRGATTTTWDEQNKEGEGRKKAVREERGF